MSISAPFFGIMSTTARARASGFLTMTDSRLRAREGETCSGSQGWRQARQFSNICSADRLKPGRTPRYSGIDRG